MLISFGIDQLRNMIENKSGHRIDVLIDWVSKLNDGFVEDKQISISVGHCARKFYLTLTSIVDSRG